MILACRSKENGEAAAFDIRKVSAGTASRSLHQSAAGVFPAGSSCLQESGNEQVIFMLLDLSSLTSVRRFAETFLKSEPRLDILVNNAGESAASAQTPAASPPLTSGRPPLQA